MLSSVVHKIAGPIRLDDLDLSKSPLNNWLAYGQSKVSKSTVRFFPTAKKIIN